MAILVTRRAALGLGGAALLAALAPRSRAQQSGVPACVVRPQQTEGPFFLDERLNRSDIRSDPGSGAIKTGTPLRVAFKISRINGTSCTALSGAIVDVWHCDAAGAYSGVRDASGSTVGQKFLRGYQVTDANGTATFATIYPGWYSGRAVHVHFKIRTAEARRAREFEFTSQIYFDETVNDRILARAPYAGRGRRDVRNDQDGMFRRDGRQLLMAVREDGEGYAGTFEVGLTA